MMDRTITRDEIADLRRIRAELMPADTLPLVWAVSETATMDESVALIRRMLEHYPERHTFYAVQTDDAVMDGYTLCLTGNGPRAAANAEWLSLIVPAVPALLAYISALEQELAATEEP